MIRSFVLRRDQDVSGVSGIGIIAEGVQFQDTKECVVHWLGNHACTNFYHSIDDVIYIHGHENKTTVVWQDDIVEKKAANG